MSRQVNQHSINVEVVNERPRAFLRLKDAARDLGCSPNHIRNLIAAGKVRAVMLDGLKLIPAKDWAEYTATAKPIAPGKKIEAASSA